MRRRAIGMKKYAPWIKVAAVLAVIIFALVKIDPFSKIKNDPVDILNQDNLAKNVDIDSISPDTVRYSERVIDEHASIDKIEFDKKSGILKIRYYDTSHMDGEIEVRNFAYQSANLLNDLKGNREIKGIEFSQKISMRDNQNIEDAIYAYFDRNNFDSIDYTKWEDDFRKKNKFPLFYNRANKYKMYIQLQDDMEREAADILKHSNEIK